MGGEWFRSRIDAKIAIELFRRRYIEVRPPSSLEKLTLVVIKQKIGLTNSPSLALL
jgi:hypothetical protein